MTNGRSDFNRLISRVLLYGVMTSFVIILFGVVMILVGDRASNFPIYLEQLVSMNYGRPTTNFFTLAHGLLKLDPVNIIQLGLLILLATPISRVVFSIFLFIREKDDIYISLTIFVLIVLLIAIFVVGPVEAI